MWTATIRHTLGLVEELVEGTGRSLGYFRSYSVAYQSGVINLLNDEQIGYATEADLDETAREGHPGGFGAKLAAV